MKKTIIIVASLVILSALVGGYFFHLRSGATPPPPPSAKVIYKVKHADDPSGGQGKTEYHAVNFDGSNDAIIYTIDFGGNPTLLDHTGILVGTHIFDATGKSLNDQYKNLGFDEQMLSLSSAGSPVYSADKNLLALFFVSEATTSSRSIEIEILNLANGGIEKYLCEACTSYQPDVKSLDGFSSDGKKLYYSLRKNPTPQSRPEPDERFFTLDVANGEIKEINFPWQRGDYDTVFPSLGRAVKITNPVGLSPQGSKTALSMVNLSDFSQKYLNDDSIISTHPIFNGTDIVYTTYRMTTATSGVQEIMGVNSSTGAEYDIISAAAFDHPHDAIIVLHDFVPNSRVFLYEVVGGGLSSEIRVHNIDTREDRSLLEIKNAGDRTTDTKQFIGVIF